jgi:ribosomal protein S18 acetylase RimI-like enzyme
VTVRRLRPDEAAQLRDLRLRALAADPGAFAEPLDSARSAPPERWERWAAQRDDAVFVALDGARYVGMAAGAMHRELQGAVWLYALWVEPDSRGNDLGARLIEAVAGWAREQGATRLDLSVTTNNAAAAALYTRAGFGETGRRRPLPGDPSRTEVFLTRPIRPAGPPGR